MQERLIEKKVCDYGAKTGWLVRKLQWIGRHGAPDRLFMLRGLAIFIEFKQFKKKLTEHQRLEHERMAAAGMKVFKIDTVDEGKALLDRYRMRNTDDLI
jgi:hypothetical protein